MIVTLHSSDSFDPCLRINISNLRKSAYIETVGIDPSCKIPQSHGGSWLIRMANSFLCSIGVGEAFVDDDARLTCGTYKPKIILLRIFQGRYSGWYENFGYKPDFYRTEGNKTKALKAMQQLHDLPARELYRQSDPLLLSEKYPPGNLNLGDYMISIWNEDCSDYSRLESFLRSTDGSWSPLIETIDRLDRLTNDELCRQ